MPNNIYNNLSDDQLKAGYWYVTHRILLRKLIVFILAVIAGGLLLFGVTGIIDYYGTQGIERNTLQGDISKIKLNQALLMQVNTPMDLRIVETEVFKTGDSSYDIYTELYNPNISWYAESFDYYYLYGDDQKSEVRKDFILPEDTKYVLYLGLKSEKNVSKTNLIIENIKWKKVADYQNSKKKFLNFVFENVEILSSQQSGLSKEGDISNIRFDVINKSSYNFWEPKFTILILRRDEVIAITQTTVKSINSAEKITESLNIFQNIPRGVELKIIPDLDILNPAIFKSFENN